MRHILIVVHSNCRYICIKIIESARALEGIRDRSLSKSEKDLAKEKVKAIAKCSRQIVKIVTPLAQSLGSFF